LKIFLPFFVAKGFWVDDQFMSSKLFLNFLLKQFLGFEPLLIALLYEIEE
jgi:hypothetical protein